MADVRVWINELEFNDGSKISFNESDIVVFVGANNAGKSATLKEAYKLLENVNYNPKILKSLSFNHNTTDNDFISYFTLKSKKKLTASEERYAGIGYDLSINNAQYYWKNSTRQGLVGLLRFFAYLLTTEERLSTVKPPQNIRLTVENEKHPIHFLQKNDSLENQFSNYFKQAFGLDLIVHRNAGSEVPLYVGTKPTLEEGEDRLSNRYNEELEKLDLLHEQGDGMRSFVGVLLDSFVSHHSILFIDEPEAFLHPPQARLLGKMLAKDLPSGKQLFIATHSEDFLKGLLDADVNNLKIIRINRQNNINYVSLLNNEELKALWSDSLLRHSNILNGLFHSGVVICESDSDCQFYSAILSALYDDTNAISPDLLFVQCGGKHRIPTIIKALRKLNVPIKVIVDFDILSENNPLKEIYENLGGDWNEIEQQWRLIKTSIDSKRPELEADAFKKEIDTILSSINDRIVPKEKVSEIQRLLRKTSAWSQAKESGKSYIPSGDPTSAYMEILNLLKQRGIFIVEVGELESFVRSVGNHGPKWVNEILATKNLKTEPELEEARSFVRQLVS